MKVLEAIQRSTEFLGRKGVESPRLQAELLLAHVLGLPRMQLYLNFERALTDTEIETCRELVKRRGQREPLQQILGSTSFCGLEIELNRHVLVPRPETELLAELGWQFLSTLMAAPPMALDFGTGSGCIAIALAVKCPAASVWALDVSDDALVLARHNAERHGAGQRIRFLTTDRLSAMSSGDHFHLIISNPPYIPAADIEKLQPEVRDYEPRQALDGGLDGLVFYRRLATEAAPWLTPGGKLMVEFGDGQAESIRKIFQEQNWIVERVVEDYTRRLRILVAALS